MILTEADNRRAELLRAGWQPDDDVPRPPQLEPLPTLNSEPLNSQRAQRHHQPARS